MKWKILQKVNVKLKLFCKTVAWGGKKAIKTPNLLMNFKNFKRKNQLKPFHPSQDYKDHLQWYPNQQLVILGYR